MKVSIIIPCYNAAKTVGTQLEALANQDGIVSPDIEVIFVENGSRDQSRAIAEQYRGRLPNLHIVDASAHRGRPQARNAGAKAATGEALLFCDADDEVAPGWLPAMSQALATHQFVACRFDVQKLNPPWLQHTRGTPQQNDLPRLWYPPFLLYGGGSSLGISRALHQAVGGFDETLPFLEDADYCVRVQQYTGEDLHFVPEALVHIRHRTSLLGLYAQARHWAQYNELLFKRYRHDPSDASPRWRAYRAEWRHLLRDLSQCVRYKEGRARLFWQVGWQLGLLEGALRYRVPPVSVWTPPPQSEQRLQAILDFCPAVIQVKDLDGRYLLVNRQWEMLFHRTRQSVSGVSVHDVFPKEIADVLRANDLRVLESRRALEIEETVLLDNGQHIFRSLKFPLVDASGLPYAVCGIATDVTDRNQVQTPRS